jgi:hypothetical protein
VYNRFDIAAFITTSCYINSNSPPADGCPVSSYACTNSTSQLNVCEIDCGGPHCPPGGKYGITVLQGNAIISYNACPDASCDLSTCNIASKVQKDDMRCLFSYYFKTNI